MKKITKIKIAWTLWHLLGKWNDKIWERYEQDFIDIIIGEIEKDELISLCEAPDDVIPF